MCLVPLLNNRKLNHEERENFMQYRKFGKLDWKVSALGFGIMRLPMTDGDPPIIDEAESIRMVRYAIDHGVNYLDTAYMYLSGQSEGFVGRVLKDGYRQKVKLTTKLPTVMVESTSDFDRFLDEQLERLQTKPDFYLLHDLNSKSWPKVRDLGILDWADDKLARGKIDHLGFSFHDEFDLFKEIIDAYDNWTLSQIYYNYMFTNYQAGRRGLEYAASKGLAVVIMGPLRGGLLAKEPPEQVAKIWATNDRKRTPAERGLLWTWNQPEISVVLSGMNTMEQVVENVAAADQSGAIKLTADELMLFDRAREVYHGLIPIPCTGCGYCMPCPNGVAISANLWIYNEATMYDDFQAGRSRYHGDNGLKEERRADQCTECGECLDACPQNIAIPDWLRKVHAKLESAE